MKDKAKYTLLTLALLLCSVRAWTQAGVVFPVDVNVTLTPPYGTCLTDLAGSDRFRIQALLRDMSHMEFRMVIQMTVKDLSSLNVRFRSTTDEFSLNAGKPTKIIGRTSLDGIGISDFFESRNVSAGYSLLNGKCLPEGAYIFSFQAFDALSYGSARIPISREVSITAFLEGGATPILTAPAQNDSIGCGSLSIRFSWMQPFVTSGLNTYRLQVMELNGDFPGTGLINSESNLMLNMQTMMPSYTWNPTAGGLEKGKSYLWRVVMCDKNGNPRSNYPNGGASETRKFVYCGEPQAAHKDPWAEWKQSEPKAKSIRGGLDTIRIDTVKTDGASGLSAFCLKDPQELRLNYDGIIVEVKKENNDSWAPFKLESRDVKDTIVGIGNIDYDKYYQARAQYFKYDGEQTIYAPYSRTVTFIVKHPADSIECGNELPPLSDCNGRQPQELKEGDRFNSNGSDVTILELTKQVRDGNALRISGTGYIDFPILRNFKFKVKFDDIKLNCDHQLTDGTLSSVYDKSTSATIDLNNAIGKGSGGYDLPQNDPAITDAQGLTDGNVRNAPQGSLFSSGSSIFLKTDGGDTVRIGTKIDLSSPSVYMDEKTRSDDALVWFENADCANVAFDNDSTWEYHKRAAISDQYEFFVAGKYIIPWVATSPGRIVKVNARPGKGFNYTDLRFVLKTAGGHIELNAEKNADGTYTLSVPGTEPANETHIYAIARPKDGRPFENVGRLKVACLEHRDQKVVLVPLARNLTIDRTAIERLLNRIYGKLGYTFSVSYDSDKAHTSRLAGIDSLNTGSGMLTEYSDEMKRVVDTYIASVSTSGGEIDKESVFLFLMNSASDPSIAGIMPQKHPFGFIFMNGKTSNDADLNRTIAHELGHGLWGLDHTFSSAYAFPKGSTTHLMDYAGGTYLAHFEWLQINKPVLSWSLFNSDEGNEAVVSDDLMEKAWILANQIYEEESQYGKTIVYYNLTKEISQKNLKDITSNEENSCLNYVPGQIGFQNGSISYLWFENKSKKRIIEKATKLTNSASVDFKNILEIGTFILYRAEDGSVQACAIPSANANGVEGEGETLASHVKDNWQNCTQKQINDKDGEYKIKKILQALAMQFRGSQSVEYVSQGIAYRLNGDGEIEQSSLSEDGIIKGRFGGADEIYRFEKNEDGILQLSAYGINQSLTNIQGKTVAKEALAKYIKETANKLLAENRVSSPEQKPTQSLDGDAFPDGDKMAINKDAFFPKIISEIGGITLTLLKTSEVEPQVYYSDASKLPEDARKDPIIHAPAILTGVAEGVGQEVTDITSLCSMVYGVVVDKEERQNAIDGFVALKDQVKDDPTTLFPLLGDVVLASATSSTSGDFEEMTDGSTDGGRSGHLKTRTATGSVITVVETAVGGGTAMLPSISKKLAQKIRLQKWLKKIDLPDGVDTKTFTKALDNLEDGGEAFLKDFEEASGEVVERLVKKPELVDAWTRLRKIGVNEKIFKDVDALEAWTKLESVSVSKVAPTVMEPLKIVGLTDDEIGKLITINRKASVGNATKAEIKLSQEIAEVCFDLPKKGDRITKIITVGDFYKYYKPDEVLTAPSGIGGCIAKKSDYIVENASSQQIIVDFGLHYEGSKFSTNKKAAISRL